MDVVKLTTAQFEEFLKLADQEISPDGTRTHVWDDFPVILGPDNRDWALGIFSDGCLVAGLSCLIRQFKTSCGTIPVAGVGQVVTRPDHRGQGYSGALQSALLDRLREANVPLAVLWTDNPAVYAGRGFQPAGWEFHVDLVALAQVAPCPAGFGFRPFETEDLEAMEKLYNRHPYRTLRHPGDADRLYSMPGTRGLVAVGQDNTLVAGVFCGKGADFPNYVTEWAGPHGLVIPLLEEVRRLGWARHLLVPAGEEKLAEVLESRGATVNAVPSGHWVVLQPEQLSQYLHRAGQGTPQKVADPRVLLGHVDDDGVVQPGALTVAVWGFDSV